jgi:hypothetical protein
MWPIIPALQDPAPLRSTEGVAAAERAFAALAARQGTRAAFLEYLAEGSWVFTPAATLARAHYSAQAPDASRLIWEPEYVELAAAGDFALSTGPWTWTPPGGTQPTVHGHFLSLWGIREGRWKVLLDVGVPHAPVSRGALVGRTSGLRPEPTAGAALQTAWASFDAAAAGEDGLGLKRFAAPDLRLYRAGRAPVPEGRAPMIPAGTAWRVGGQHVATSLDLAVRWGERIREGSRASAVQVWRRTDRGWELAMDVELPIPPGKP